MRITYNAIEEQQKKEDAKSCWRIKLEKPIRHQYIACKECPICHSNNVLIMDRRASGGREDFQRTSYYFDAACRECNSKWSSDPFCICIESLSGRYKPNGSFFELDSYYSSLETKYHTRDKVKFVLLVAIPLIVSIIICFRFGLGAGIACLIVLGIISLAIYGAIAHVEEVRIDTSEYKHAIESINKEIKERSHNSDECYVYIGKYGDNDYPQGISDIVDELKQAE